MITFSNQEVAVAIKGIQDKLGIVLDTALQKEYQDGKYPRLLSYEKVEEPDKKIPAIQKYLIAAQTYLNQPCQFYDIFRCCRLVIFIQILNQALNEVLTNSYGYEPRLEKLLAENDSDSFESVLCELAVAAAYCAHPHVKRVMFIEDATSKSPDLQIDSDTGELYVECKKFDRSVDMANDLRNAVRDNVRKAMEAFETTRNSAIIEIAFHTNPQSLSPQLIRQLCLESYRVGTPIIDKWLTVNVKPLPKQKLDSYTLYPSPKYYWERYGYKVKSEWFGIVTSMYARYARLIEVAGSDGTPISTWLDDVDFECVVKWKVTDSETIWQQKRLGYTRLFKGLSQLQSRGSNSVLHAWIERDTPLGPRQSELMDFFGRLEKSARDVFAWIIFNEICLDVSIEGRFDMIEYAHRIRGPGSQSVEPLISNVFTAKDPCDLGIAEFGIGHELPDIDEYFHSA